MADSAIVTLGDDARLGTSDLVSRLDGARWQKMIAAGNSVAVGVEQGSRRSVLIAELSTRPIGHRTAPGRSPRAGDCFGHVVKAEDDDVRRYEHHV